MEFVVVPVQLEFVLLSSSGSHSPTYVGKGRGCVFQKLLYLLLGQLLTPSLSPNSGLWYRQEQTGPPVPPVSWCVLRDSS